MAHVPEHVPLRERIRNARKKKGLSQEKLAGRLKTSRQRIIKWEKGDNAPSAEYREKLSREFGCPAEHFALSHADVQEDFIGHFEAVTRELNEHDGPVPPALADDLVQLVEVAYQIGERVTEVAAALERRLEPGDEQSARGPS